MFRLCVFLLSCLVLTRGELDKVCNVWGDPHVITFDGLKYKFGGVCNYALALDCTSISWVIYGRFSPCGTGSCLEDISIFYQRPGQKMDTALLGRGWLLNHEGNKVPAGENLQLGAISVAVTGMYMEATLEGAGVKLIWDGAFGLQIAIDSAVVPAGSVCGLCGNHDDLASNEAEQMREIGNDLEGTGMTGLEGFVYQWKIDRGNYCEDPVNVEYSRDLPCGNNYRKNERARVACQEIIDNQELFRCHETLNLNTFYEACLADYCHLEGLVPGYPVACVTASAYAKQCQVLGAVVRDEVWRKEMSCPEEEVTQQAVLEFGGHQA